MVSIGAYTFPLVLELYDPAELRLVRALQAVFFSGHGRLGGQDAFEH